jgi:transposase
VGPVGAVAAGGYQVGPAAGALETAAHRRDPVAYRAGVPWRDIPERYGPWETVYGLFRRWQRDGTWQDILTKLQAQADADGLITWDVSVDSTVNRAHQHAAGARKKGLSSANLWGSKSQLHPMSWQFVFASDRHA